MSYVAVDLKAIEVEAPSVARAANISVQRAIGGLVLLWHRVWSTEKLFVTKTHLAGAFGRQRIDDVVEALEADFLKPVEGGWEVRGAERYLRVKTGLRKGGKASKGNLKKGDKAPGCKPESSPALSRDPPPAPSRLVPGLSPSTEHRALREDPPLSPATDEAPEGLNYEISKFGNSDPRAHAFFAWCDGYRRAKGLERAPPPGGPAWEWAAGFFAKYGEQAGVPCELAIRACYVDFVGWAVSSGLVPNWGLWLAQAVWEPRYADVRVGGLREALNEAVRFGEPAQRPLGLGPLGIAV